MASDLIIDVAVPYMLCERTGELSEVFESRQRLDTNLPSVQMSYGTASWSADF